MKIGNKKAQSAMEYLMTYGWAILIVVIVAAALYALGVFNPAAYTSDLPTGFPSIGTPNSWALGSDGEFKVELTNNKLASTVQIKTVKASLRGTTQSPTYNTSTCNTTGDTPAPGDTYLTIAPSGSARLEEICQVPTCNLTFTGLTPGTSYSIDVNIVYNVGGYDKTDTGTVTGIVG